MDTTTKAAHIPTYRKGTIWRYGPGGWLRVPDPTDVRDEHGDYYPTFGDELWAAGFNYQPGECAPVEEGALPGVAAVHPHRSDRERWLVEIVAADDIHVVEVIGLPDLVELTSKLGPVARKPPSEQPALSFDAPRPLARASARAEIGEK